MASLSAVGRAKAAEYYFSALGSDVTGNGSLANPWQSITKFNTLNLDPGDSVFFRRGDRFDGSLSLNAADTGTSAAGALIAPITVGSYGSVAGRAIIRSLANQPALLSRDNGGIEIQDLEFTNGGSYATNSSSGMVFEITRSATPSLTHFQHIKVSNVVSHGFHQSGLSLYASSDVGYDNVSIIDSEFHGNQYSGVQISAGEWTQLIHRNVHVDNITTHDNPGFAGCSPHCGHGLVVGQVDGATIENSRAYSNGIAAGKGNVGLWAWQSNNVTIQRNDSYDNRSPLGGDGGGFDLDGGMTNSIMQYNVSRNNDGAGYLLAEFEYAEPMSQNVIRYNISSNDGRDGYGGITVWGATLDYAAATTVIHNNTIVVDKSVAPASRGPLWFLDSHHNEVDLINNVFLALNGAQLLDGMTTPTQSRLLNNAYWTGGQPVSMNGVVYESVAHWAAANGQEVVKGQFLGLEVNPSFLLDGSFRTAAVSSLINAGMPLDSAGWPAWLGTLNAADVYGVSVPQSGVPDIGAIEFMTGDYNRDGVVNMADYLMWRSTFGQNVAAGVGADGNGGGFVDAAGYVLWRHHATQLAPLKDALGNVPEPSCAQLAVVVLLILSRPLSADLWQVVFSHLYPTLHTPWKVN